MHDSIYCNSPWSPQLDFTSITSASDFKAVKCGWYRPFDSYSTNYYSAIRVGQTLNFYAGFNVFSSSADGAPDAYDSSSLISVTLIEAARAAAGLLVGSLAVLMGALV